jgi:acetate---CoA ligase (ADP-forming)
MGGAAWPAPPRRLYWCRDPRPRFNELAGRCPAYNLLEAPPASLRNPVDVAGATDRDPQLFEACVDALAGDPGVDGILCVGLLGGYGIRFSDELARAEETAAAGMAELAAKHDKPLIVQSAYFHAQPPAHVLLRKAGVPVHASVETAARCLAALWERGRILATLAERSTFPEVARTGRSLAVRTLTEPAGRELLAAHGLPVGPWLVAGSAEDAARAAERLGGPVALKIVSPDAIHKSDVGGVLLGLTGPAEARRGFEQLVAAVRGAEPHSRVEGVLVAPMAPAGVELLVGVATDPTFGPVLTVGAGGTAVELLDDTAFRALPVTALECREVLDELALRPLLEGFRGGPPVDLAGLVELLGGVSRLVEAEPGVVELDLNPVVAHPGGLELVDVRVVVAGER